MARFPRSELILALALVGCEGGATVDVVSDAGDAECALFPGLDAARCDEVTGWALPDSLPPAHGNRFADDERAALLGLRLFYDRRFSATGEIACANCHAPESDFHDREPVATGGIGTVHRNTPSIFDAARYRWSQWDGRADSLWSQAIQPLESPAEMGLTRLEIAHKLARYWAEPYQEVFGALPSLDDETRFPPRGGPGDDAWEQMREEDRRAVLTVVANVGKALEAMERRVATGPAHFDRHLTGEQPLDDAARRGFVALDRHGCFACHGGPTFTDDAFHDVGTGEDDPGRARAIEALLASDYSAASPDYDGPPPADWPPSVQPGDEGAFRTPTLRNVTSSAPYGHDGRWRTLEDALAAHAEVPFTTAELSDVVAFLGALEGERPPPPWDDWPHF